jgi:hypothetical protein
MRKRKIYHEGPFVVFDGEYLNLYTHDGHLVNGNVFIRVHDEVGKCSEAVCKFIVNIVGSVDEMNEIIKQWEK